MEELGYNYLDTRYTGSSLETNIQPQSATDESKEDSPN